MLEPEKSASISMEMKKKFAFRPRKEQCSMICIKYGPNPQGLREVHIQHQMVDMPVKKNKEIKKKPE